MCKAIYSLRWADGSKSACNFDKDKIIDVVNRWINNKTGWTFIEVINTITNRRDVIFEEEVKSSIGNILV